MALIYHSKAIVEYKNISMNQEYIPSILVNEDSVENFD